MSHEKQARERVANDAALAAHAETIFYDWPEGDEHLEWIATAPISEIVDWAETVEAFGDSRAASSLGRRTSKRKADAARANGRKGGRPRKAA